VKVTLPQTSPTKLCNTRRVTYYTQKVTVDVTWKRWG